MKKTRMSPILRTFFLSTLILLLSTPAGIAQEAPSVLSTDARVRSFESTDRGPQRFEFFGKGRLEFDAAALSPAPADPRIPAVPDAFSANRTTGIRQTLQVRSIDFSPADFPTPQAFHPRGTVFRFGPGGLRFREPALLTLPYEVVEGDETLIEIYYYNRETERWEVQPTVSRDTVNKTVTARIEHFSEYVAGMSSFKVDEAGTLDGGNRLGARVDPYLGALLIDSVEFDIPARGIPLTLKARFNSDYLYRKYIPDFTGSETTAGLTRVKPGNQVYAFPQTDIKSGWYYELPYCTFGTNILDLVLGNGQKYELSNCIVQWKSMMNGASKDYGAFKLSRPSSTLLKILIPEAEFGMQVTLNTTGVVSQVTLYYSDGSRAEFPESGAVKYQYDASGKNSLEYTFSGTTLQKVTHIDGRTLKILAYSNADTTKSFVYLLSTSPDLGTLNEGDQFLGRRIFDAAGRLQYSDSLETHSFTPVPTGFVLSAANETTYFHALQRTSYAYTLNPTVTNNMIGITEPGGAYKTYTFDISFGPGMVSRYYYYYSTKYFLYTEYTHVYQVEYQNKPKVVSENTQKSSGDTEYKKTDYLYNGNYKNLFTASDYHYYYQGTYGGGTGTGYPTPYNTQPANTQKTTYKVTSLEADYLVREKVTYAHETINPYYYKGISQDLVLAYDGTTSGTSTEYEKMTRTFTEIYGNYYPEVETTYRGGSPTAAWTVSNTYDSYGRLTTKNDTRSGNRCLYYLYNGTTGNAGFSYPGTYTVPTTRDLYTAFGVVGGVGNEVAASTYHKEYRRFDDNLNVVETLQKELVPNGAGGYAEANATTLYSYDTTTNNLTSVTFPSTDTISISYGSGWKSSFVTQDSRTLSTTPLQYLKTDFDYDIRGRLISKRAFITDNLGTPIVDQRFPLSYREYSYDGLSRVLSVSRRNSDNSTVELLRKVYDDTNLTVLSTDTRGYQTLTQYDTFFRPVSRFSYRPDTDARTAAYDGTGRTELSHSAYAYDPARFGLLLSETTYLVSGDQDPLTMTYTYDTLGRRTKAERSRSGTTVTISETSYDDLTNTETTKTYRTGTEYTAVRVDKDWLDRPEVESAWTGTNQTGTQLNTQYAYDVGGRLVSKTLPSGEVYTYAYTSAGRLARRTYPNNRGTETLTYDLAGRLQTSTDLNGSVTTLAYNPAGLVERKTVSRNSVVDETVDTTYGPYGPLTVTKYPGSPTLPELEYGYRYGPDGLVREEARTLWISGTPYTSTVARELDDAGNLESLSVTGLGGFSKIVTYSAPGFGASIPGTSGYSTTAYTGASTALATVSATRKGREALAYGNGLVTAYSYDPWLGLSGMDQPGTPHDQAYTRDYTGKVTSWTKGTANALSFSYDGLGRLASGEGVNYGYDTTGNMTTAVGGDPSAFAYQVGTTGNSMLIDSTSGTATVDYSTDTEGNVLEATGRFGTISYDFSNRIMSIANTVRGVTDSYAYDASGLRYRKTESVDGTQVQTFTVYSGNDILLEETYSEGAWKTARIEFSVAGAAAGRFEKDYSTSQEAIRYYYQDHLGSRIGVADEMGAVLATIAYDIWGNAAASGVAGYDAESEIRFTGKPMDATGLYYFNARYYDPQSKRFLTEDPIQQGMNWYTYCGNDPVNFTDPTGLYNVESDDGRDTRENRQIERQHQADEKRNRSNEETRDRLIRGDTGKRYPVTQKDLISAGVPNAKESCHYLATITGPQLDTGDFDWLDEAVTRISEYQNNNWLSDTFRVLEPSKILNDIVNDLGLDRGSVGGIQKTVPAGSDAVIRRGISDNGNEHSNLGNPDGTFRWEPWDGGPNRIKSPSGYYSLTWE